MRLKQLESALSSVPTKRFPDPKIELEQYATSPHLTAAVILTALQNEDVGPGVTVMDLGCGTGMLTIGSALVATDHIMSVDCDEDAMAVARENVGEMGLGSGRNVDEGGDDDSNFNEDIAPPIDFIFAKVHHECTGNAGSLKGLARGGRGRGRDDRRKGSRDCRGERFDRFSGKGGSRQRLLAPHSAPMERSIGDRHDSPCSQSDGLPFRNNCVDTVLTNPPFGTKQNAGIDVTFLRAACRLATRAVYSFHKTSTRPYLIKTIKNWGYEVEVCAEMKFDVPKSYSFHKQNNVDVEVDLIRVILSNDATS